MGGTPKGRSIVEEKSFNVFPKLFHHFTFSDEGLWAAFCTFYCSVTRF